jgi:predicted nucleotidyltransferase
MEALSRFDIAQYEAIEERLKALRDPDAFLSAHQAFSANGPVVRFGWPDWPEDLSLKLKKVIDDLHQSIPFLKPVAPDTEEWNSVIQGWQSDPESAKAIGVAFSASDCFDGRVQWVFSRRDRRGKIAASCLVDELGEINLDITWRGCFAVPMGSLSVADRASLSAAIEKLTQWTGRRIKRILEELHVRLAALYGDHIRGLYVYGSYARPDAGIDLGGDSDLDVALILTDFESPYAEIEKFSPITSNLSSEHGLVISVVPIREADFKQGKTNFIRTISEYAIPVP